MLWRSNILYLLASKYSFRLRQIRLHFPLNFCIFFFFFFDSNDLHSKNNGVNGKITALRALTATAVSSCSKSLTSFNGIWQQQLSLGCCIINNKSARPTDRPTERASEAITATKVLWEHFFMFVGLFVWYMEIPIWLQVYG